MKILIAEDDFTSRNILTAILKKWGHELVVTKDGLEAWEALQQPDAPGLVLLDWDMPGMEGPEVCRRLREQETSNPAYVILLTGRGEKGDIVHGLEAGANDYVAKPYDNEELHARIGVGQRMLELQCRLVETRDALEHLAMHDPLTGVFNRRAILDRIKAELSRAKREEGKVSVGMCDLDHFKKINDTHGHQTGDDVLVAFTERIQANLRDYDCIGRYGGEEFLVVAAARKGDVEGNLFERLCAEVAKSEIKTEAGPVALTVSIGVASGTGEATVAGLVAEADTALYQAKSEGRNRVVHARPSGILSQTSGEDAG